MAAVPQRDGTSSTFERAALIAERWPWLPYHALCVGLDYGYLDDLPGAAGLAHLLEHLWCAHATEHDGVFVWGQTREHLMLLHEVAEESDLGDALRRTGQRAIHFSSGYLVDDDKLARQRRLVQDEMRLHVHERAYGGFPDVELAGLMSGAPAPYGDEESLAAITVSALADAAVVAWQPERICVAVVGPCSVEEVLSIGTSVLGEMPFMRPHRITASRREQIHGYAARFDAAAPFPAVALGWVIDPADAATAQVMCHVLRNRKERSSAASKIAVNPEFSAGPRSSMRDGVLVVFTALHELRFGVAEVRSALLNPLAELVSRPIEDWELTAAGGLSHVATAKDQQPEDRAAALVEQTLHARSASWRRKVHTVEKDDVTRLVQFLRSHPPALVELRCRA